MTTTTIFRQPIRTFQTTKVCRKCRELLPIEQFHVDPKAPDGLRSQCKLCRSTVKDKPVGLDYTTVHADRWLREAAIACPCAVCGGSSELPATVTEALMALHNDIPLCKKHRDTRSVKVELKRRQWHRIISSRLVEINTSYLLTMHLLMVPKLRRRLGGLATKWLSGDRFDDEGISILTTSDALASLYTDAYMSLFPLRTKKRLPEIITYDKRKAIHQNEIQMAYLMGVSGKSEVELLEDILHR